MWLPWSRIARLDDTISSDYAIEREGGGVGGSEMISRL